MCSQLLDYTWIFSVFLGFVDILGENIVVQSVRTAESIYRSTHTLFYSYSVHTCKISQYCLLFVVSDLDRSSWLLAAMLYH